MINLSTRSRWFVACIGIGVIASACSGGGSPGEDVDLTSEVTSAPAPTSTDVATTTTAPAATTTDTAPAMLDACEIVDEADASELLGSEAQIEGPTGANCAWTTDSGALLVVIVTNGSQFFMPAEEGSEPLSIGDEAWILVEENFGGTQIHVLQGDWVLNLSVTPFGVDDVEGLAERMTLVAERASNRLP